MEQAQLAPTAGHISARDAAQDQEAHTKSPADLTITIRDERFGRNDKMNRWWMGGDPIATAFYNSLSITFPKGEAFFIESVKNFRDGTSERLNGEIRAFVRQEINHTREHVAFNRRVVDAGYDVAYSEQMVEEALALTKDKPPIANLLSTMALEHFTAIFAQQLLENPAHLEKADPESRGLWRWHAIEEIEHKGVAYDTFLHATRGWSGWQRYKTRSLVMVLVTKNFMIGRTKSMLDLLKQDGISGSKTWWRIAKFYFGKPGMIRKIFPAWLSWFKPNFHPWDHDDRALIQLHESDYRDAIMDSAKK